MYAAVLPLSQANSSSSKYCPVLRGLNTTFTSILSPEARKNFFGDTSNVPSTKYSDSWTKQKGNKVQSNTL